MNPRDALREEHGEIMKMLVVLQRFSTKLVDLEAVDANDLEVLVEFFEIYVDRCHHGKEEHFLFPALSRAGCAETDSLIRSLIDDHRQAQVNMEKLKFDARTLQSCTVADRKAFSEGAEHYVDLVRKHIRKENSALLPLIESLSDTDRLRMAEQFRELEKATMGPSRFETFLAGVRELSQKYSREKI